MPYRLRAQPVAHEAVEWTGENLDEVVDFCRTGVAFAPSRGVREPAGEERAAFRGKFLYVLLEGQGMVYVPVGSMIVRTEMDMLRSFTKEEFDERYVEVL